MGFAASIGPSLVKEVEAAEEKKVEVPQLEQHKTICSNCSVGCGFIGEVQNGVWVSQEPWFEHPINLGSLCSKGSGAREHVISEKRLRYPMKLESGKWKRLSWEQAMGEIPGVRDPFARGRGGERRGRPHQEPGPSALGGGPEAPGAGAARFEQRLDRESRAGHGGAQGAGVRGRRADRAGQLDQEAAARTPAVLLGASPARRRQRERCGERDPQ